jgi:phosphoribosyl-ATP pyrophosphohydrolase/phosphoribosyl-AMP cyclohydrolase
MIKFDKDGLVPVIVQDKWTSEVLMMAYANRESLERTIATGEMFFFSRSRQCLWHKGETSGSFLILNDLIIDCDGDTLLAKVKPMGPACHTGNRTCFFRDLVSSSSPELSFLDRLWKHLKVRKDSSPEESYTARLLTEGKDRIGQKIGEEGVETAIAVATDNREQVSYETADLLYHIMVGLLSADLELEDIISELEKRHK